MALLPAQTVRRLLSNWPGEALCDSCLAFACGTSLADMSEITAGLVVEDADIQRGRTCANCRRTVTCIFYRSPRKCSHCSQPLDAGESGVFLGADRFHDTCLRRLMSDETIRMSRFLSRRSRAMIERSRKRMREGHAWPDVDPPTDPSAA